MCLLFISELSAVTMTEENQYLLCKINSFYHYATDVLMYLLISI